jgi:hypothetical protein
MFIKNIYYDEYLYLIEKCSLDTHSITTKYYENHHIIPRSLGGSNQENNLIALPPDLHLVAHYLLWKCVEPEVNNKMLYALNMMLNRTNLFEDVSYGDIIKLKDEYKKIREDFSSLQKIKFSGSGNPMYGKTHTDEVKSLLRKLKTGSQGAIKGREAYYSTITGQLKYFKIDSIIPEGWIKGNCKVTYLRSEETKRKLRRPKTEQEKQNMRRPHRPLTENEKIKKSQVMKAVFASNSIICNVCGFEGKHPSNMKRYHFNNCKKYAK